MTNSRQKMPLSVKLAAAILFISGMVLPEVVSLQRDDYHSAANYISELGAVGAEKSSIINFFGFLPVALASAFLLVFIRCKLKGYPLARIGAVLILIGVAVGYLTAFLFPCDYGCPIEGSARQAVHNLAGLVEYPLGALGLILLGVGMKGAGGFLRFMSIAIGVGMAVGFVMMIAPDQAAFRGAWQRLGDYPTFLLLIYLAFRLRPHDLESSA